MELRIKVEVKYVRTLIMHMRLEEMMERMEKRK
jgi:hypothetical protein